MERWLLCDFFFARLCPANTNLAVALTKTTTRCCEREVPVAQTSVSSKLRRERHLRAAKQDNDIACFECIESSIDCGR